MTRSIFVFQTLIFDRLRQAIERVTKRFLRRHTSLKKLGCRSLLPQCARFPIPDGPKIEKSRVDRSEVTSNLIGRYYVPRKLSEGDVWTEKFFDVFRFERHISVWKTKTTVRPELSEWIIPFRQNNNKHARKRRATKFDCFPRIPFTLLSSIIVVFVGFCFVFICSVWIVLCWRKFLLLSFVHLNLHSAHCCCFTNA